LFFHTGKTPGNIGSNHIQWQKRRPPWMRGAGAECICTLIEVLKRRNLWFRVWYRRIWFQNTLTFGEILTRTSL